MYAMVLFMFNINMLSLPLLMGAPAGGAASSSPQGSMAQIGMIVAVFAIFWFLIIRPQRKKQKETKDMLAAIKKGDRVISIGGIRGKVKTLHDNTVVLEVDSKGNTLEFLKTAIGSVEQSKETSTPAPKKNKKPKAEESKKVSSTDNADSEAAETTET